MKEDKDLYSSYIANCVFNACSSYAAIMLNSLTIYALRKTSSLPKPLKPLLMSLAVSDLAVGLLAQPLYIAVTVTEFEENSQSNRYFDVTYKVYLFVVNLLTFASFFGVMALSADRFLAIHLHLRYQELVTYKRVVMVVFTMWAVSTSLATLRLCIPKNICYLIFYAIYVCCFLATTAINYRIYVTLRRHANQIRAMQAQQAPQHGEMANIASLRKFAVGTLLVYLAFVICYLPDCCRLVIFAVSKTSTSKEILRLYTLTLWFLNSSLNPVIYCWKMRPVRLAALDVLRKILWSCYCLLGNFPECQVYFSKISQPLLNFFYRTLL